MQLDHDHDETVHTHAHTHADGVTHTHAHTHTHDHENEHTHSHDDCGHTHCDACGGCEHSPKEELMALMKYMVGHNASHANELILKRAICACPPCWRRCRPRTHKERSSYVPFQRI